MKVIGNGKMKTADENRLDISWKWLDYARSKNGLISITPNAHAIQQFSNTRHGVLVA